MKAPLSPFGRRVLAHLPVWTADEAALIAEEGGPEHSIRDYSVPELVARLAEDPFCPALDEGATQLALEALQAEGWAKEKGGRWRMTKGGFDALHAPEPEAAELKPGPVTMNLAPAEAKASAVLG